MRVDFSDAMHVPTPEGPSPVSETGRGAITRTTRFLQFSLMRVLM